MPSPDDYFDNIHRIMSVLDEENIRVIGTMKKFGPRNLQQVARRSKVPYPTVYTRINKLQKELEQLIQTMQALVDELSSFGCELKDPTIGLIDFLSLRNGREVYLCWHLGEERINFWHYLDAGFAGRQPL